MTKRYVTSGLLVCQISFSTGICILEKWN